MSVLEDSCVALVNAATMLTWEFDPRFRAASAAFPAADAATVRAALEAGFDAAWSGSTIGAAPPRAQELSTKLGGMRAGQLLFSAHAESDPILFGAWWPWGNGTTISIRVLFSARTLTEPEREALLVDFKAWFGLE